ncbi:MAG: hypothetical protein RLZ86_1580, partial [Actinomycetota bacterium]
SATSLNAQVGDTFTINNTSDRDISIQGPITRVRAPSNCAYLGTPWCVTTTPGQDSFTVDALGTVTIRVYNGGNVGAQIGTVTLGSGSSSSSSSSSTNRRPPQKTVEFHPSGGTCTHLGETYSEPWIHRTRRSWVRMPLVDACTKPGFRFVHWTSGDAVVEAGEQGSSSKDWSALWERVEPSLTVSVNGRGLVSERLSGLAVGVLCGEGAYGFTYGTWERCTVSSARARGATITLYAVPVLGREFLGWGGACADTPVTSPCVVTPVDATEVTASFTPDVTLTAEAEGGWIYDTSSAGVLCGDDPAQILFFGAWVTLSDFGDFPIRCSSDHVRGSTVTLFAWAAPNHRFDAWGGACADVSTDESCSVTLEEAETVTASFSTATLSIEKVGEGTVQEFSLAPRIDCGTTCSTDVTPDSTVVLVAAPSSGHYFVGWGGACEGTAATSACSLTFAESTDVTATFAVGRTVTVAIDPNENNTGLVWSTSPFGVLCGGLWTLCDVTFPPDVTSVTLAAINGRDHQFIGWGGSCEETSATSLCTVEFSDEVTEHEVAATYEGRSWVRRENPFVGEAILDLSDDGTTVVGSSGSVRVWNDATATWIDRGDVGEGAFAVGQVALSADGRTVLHCLNGAMVQVKVWDPISSSWVERNTGFMTYELGMSCDIDGDGDTIAVCGQHGVRVLRWFDNSSWVQLGADLAPRYPRCALSADGNSILVEPPAALESQRIYRWNPVDNVWVQRGSPISGDYGSLNISGDGNAIHADGQVYRWDDELDDWSTPGDSFDIVVGALSSDASTLLTTSQQMAQVWRLTVRRWEPSTSSWIDVGLPISGFWVDLLLNHVNREGTRIATVNGVYDWRFASR